MSAMSYLATTIITIAVVEVFLRLPFITFVKDQALMTRKITKVISSGRISDHWKEKILPAYSGRMLVIILKLHKKA